MARPTKGTGSSFHGEAGPSKSMPLPRWITIPFILIIGLILWVGVLSDESGHLTVPGIGSIVYVAAVICIAAVLAYLDRDGPGRKGK